MTVSVTPGQASQQDGLRAATRLTTRSRMQVALIVLTVAAVRQLQPLPSPGSLPSSHSPSLVVLYHQPTCSVQMERIFHKAESQGLPVGFLVPNLCIDVPCRRYPVATLRNFARRVRLSAVHVVHHRIHPHCLVRSLAATPADVAHVGHIVSVGAVERCSVLPHYLFRTICV